MMDMTKEYNINLYNDLTDISPKIIQDQKIKLKLKEHQKTAINAMIEFEDMGKVSFTNRAYIRNYHIYNEKDSRYAWYPRSIYENLPYKDIYFEIETNYGILADKVGSGKTFMIMGLICYKQIPKDRDKIISSTVYSVTRYRDTDNTVNTNLIIVPHNLISQWQIAFNYCTLKTFIVKKKCDSNLLLKEDGTNSISEYDCIIVSSTMFDGFYSNFKELKWARIIIDEVITIKLPQDIDFKCNFIWFLTATPSGIRTVRKTYIRALVTPISDNTINYIVVKNNDEYVDRSMNLPSINQITIKCLTPKTIKLIQEYVDTETINMINAGDIQGAVNRLNCNIETTDNILDVLTNKIKKELHNRQAELVYEQSKITDDKKLHDEKINKLSSKITELQNKCKDIENRIMSFKQENCPICYMEFNDDLMPMLTSCCNNMFCLQCLTQCTKCPMCREILNITNCTYINDNIKDNITDNITDKISDKKLCSKIENLITIIKKKPQGKFLVFSNYDKTFDNIYYQLSTNNITHNKLCGSSIVINSTLRKFESGEIRVLMLNAYNYGSGLNLQMATDIIIYHELDIEMETQVIGRAQRLGRSEPLNVYYLLNDNEKINCTNPTLSLDIWASDTTMLENFINESNKDDTIDLNEDIDSSSETIIIPVVPQKVKTVRKKNGEQSTTTNTTNTTNTTKTTKTTKKVKTTNTAKITKKESVVLDNSSSDVDIENSDLIAQQKIIFDALEKVDKGDNSK